MAEIEKINAIKAAPRKAMKQKKKLKRIIEKSWRIGKKSTKKKKKLQRTSEGYQPKGKTRVGSQ